MNWSDKFVLVTGGCGFIGSHLVELLVSYGAKVRVFSRYTSTGSLNNLSFISQDNIEVIYGDLRNPFVVHKAMRDINIVFHLASLISIPYSYTNPAEYFDVNVNSILNILQAARDLSTDIVIHTSTSEVYGTAKIIPINEDHPLQAQSPYSASKIAADKLVESFYLSFGTPVLTLRPFNTYGPRQTTRAIIPTIIKQLLSKSELFLGDITPTRDFLYVKDTVKGFIMAAENYKELLGQVANIGTGHETSIKDLALLIGEFLNRKPEFFQDSGKLRPKKSEVRRLCCDSSRFNSITGWKPNYDLQQGLNETIDFYKQFDDKFNISSEFK